MALVLPERILLFDCGEGTQLRLRHAGLRLRRIEAIFITHLHGDHYFGLLGLLSTMALTRRTRSLVVVAPRELMRVMHLIPGVRDHELPFLVEYVSLPESLTHAVVFESDNYYVEARAVEHRTFTVGYRVQEKERPGRLNVARAQALGVTSVSDYRLLKRGKPVQGACGRTVTPDLVLEPLGPVRAFAYVTDTRPCEGAVILARKVTMLAHEATFTEALRHRAYDTGHSTAAQAAAIAKEAQAERLLLTHFSARYHDAATLVEEARAVFPATEEAKELQQYRLKSGNREG